MDAKLIEEKKTSLRSSSRPNKSARRRLEDKVEKYMERGYGVKAMDFDPQREEYRILMTKSDNNRSNKI